MRCQDVLEMLSPYLDGALTHAEREAVRVHLARCPGCGAELERLRTIRRLLQELPELTPPAGFRAGLMEKIEQLPAPEQVPQYKGWLDRVSGVARSTWYRMAAVAAVMAMTIGLTALWEKEGNQFLPVDPGARDTVVAVQEPQQPGKDQTVPLDDLQIPPQEPGGAVTNPAPPSLGPNVGDDATPGKTDAAVTVPNNRSIWQGESFVPQPSEGMVAASAILKLDVENLEAALKSVNAIVQNSGGSVYQPYSGSDETGTVGIKIPRSSYQQAIGSLQSLGNVVTYLPSEKDLSVTHKEAREKMRQLKARQTELEAKLTEGLSADLQKQLAEVNASLEEQIETIKQLEDRSSYCLITVTLM
ncbi:zf-HC2 domain-containing protein [Desulforamulus putei]|uniref:zf-HC2 domain-containing protein n=1 Tax=Desulforamulus putei TaxID=74701 RepID=UPI002FDE9976